MARLAIKGHATRGKEVIEILEMLGGINPYVCKAVRETCFYFIVEGKIDYDEERYITDEYTIFTLEEFLEKFPYKVGDKVIAYAEGCIAQFTIQGIRWNVELNKVEYKICSSWLDTGVIFTSSYKEETMEKEKKDYEEWFQTDYLEFENNDDTWADEVEVNLGKDYEIQIRGDKTFIVKKKSQYPKTYEECCKVLLLKPERATYSVSGLEYERHLIVNLQRLLICRDAYWKIAGKKMGLEKPWEPDDCQIVYSIGRDSNRISLCNDMFGGYFILEFPTKEMRDAFYENFKDLIEACTELL